MFRTTRWSLVIGTRPQTESGRAALEALCRTYRSPVVAYLRARGHAPSDADDLAQAFFEQLLLRRTHAVADPARGRFRTFLLTALKHFLANEREREHALKRGGDRLIVPLEPELEPDPGDDSPASPESVFERDYALTVISRAVERLRAEAVGAGKATLFEKVSPFLLEPPDQSEYAVLAEQLEMRRNTLAVAIHRLRNRLRDMVRRELQDTVDDDATLEIEMGMLRKALAGRERSGATA